MAVKKGSMADFLKVDSKSLSGSGSSWGPGNRVWEILNAKETGRNPPKSKAEGRELSTRPLPAPAPKVSMPAPKTQMLSSPTRSPELSRVISRPLEANRSARWTMGSAAARRLNNVRNNRSNAAKDTYKKGGSVDGCITKGGTKGTIR